MIRIWKFKNAPQQLQDLYPLGTDATWVLEVPSIMRGEIDGAIDANQMFINDILRRQLPDGTIILFAVLRDLTHKPNACAEGEGASEAG